MPANAPSEGDEDMAVTGQSDLDAAYAERNAVVLAFAAAMETLGYEVGQIVDESEPDWPVLVIETPRGQVSWHFRASEMPEGMPRHPHPWDGHTTDEKYRRLARLAMKPERGAA